MGQVLAFSPRRRQPPTQRSKKPFIALEASREWLDLYEKLIHERHGFEALAIGERLFHETFNRLRAGNGPFPHDKMRAFACHRTPCVFNRRKAQFPQAFELAERQALAAFARLRGEKPSEKPITFESENSTKSKAAPAQTPPPSEEDGPSDHPSERRKDAPAAAPGVVAHAAPAQREEQRASPEAHSPPAQPVARPPRANRPPSPQPPRTNEAGKSYSKPAPPVVAPPQAVAPVDRAQLPAERTPEELAHVAASTARVLEIIAAAAAAAEPTPRLEVRARPPRAIPWFTMPLTDRNGRDLPPDQPQEMPFAPLYTADLRDWEARLDELLDRQQLFDEAAE